MNPYMLAGQVGVNLLGAGAASLVGRKAARENREEIERLKRQRDFGLSPAEKGTLREELLDPQRRALETSQRAETARQAARGPVSGADIAAVRESTERGYADALERTALQIGRADLEAERRERAQNAQEIAQRQAIDQQRKADIAKSIIGATTSTAGAMGQYAALANLQAPDVKGFEEALASRSDLTPERQAELLDIFKRDPHAAYRAIMAPRAPAPAYISPLYATEGSASPPSSPAYTPNALAALEAEALAGSSAYLWDE